MRIGLHLYSDSKKEERRWGFNRRQKSHLKSCHHRVPCHLAGTDSWWSSFQQPPSALPPLHLPRSLSAFPSCSCSTARFSASFPCWMSNWGTESLHKALTPRVKEKRSCEKRKGGEKKGTGEKWRVRGRSVEGEEKKRGATREEICKKSREWGTDKEQGRRILRRGSTQKGERGWLVKVGSKETKPQWR